MDPHSQDARRMPHMQMPTVSGITLLQGLLGEHGVFYAQFERLERTIPTATSLERIQDLSGLLEAGLGSHAHLEDELLFTALDPVIGGMGPLEVMRQEHVQIEGLLGEIARSDEVEAARDAFALLLDTARNHFAKEEQVLFPLSVRRLDAGLLADRGLAWAEKRGVRV